MEGNKSPGKPSVDQLLGQIYLFHPVAFFFISYSTIFMLGMALRDLFPHLRGPFSPYVYAALFAIAATLGQWWRHAVRIPVEQAVLPSERPIKRTGREVAEILHAFLDGTLSDAAWGEFVAIEITDPALDAIRRRCETLFDDFPPVPGERSSLEEKRVIRELAGQLDRALARG